MRAHFTLILLFISLIVLSKEAKVINVSTSMGKSQVMAAFDENIKTSFTLQPENLESNQWVNFTLGDPGNITNLTFSGIKNISLEDFKKLVTFHITYDPMNWNEPVPYEVKNKGKNFSLVFAPTYGMHIKMVFSEKTLKETLSIGEIYVEIEEEKEIITQEGEVDKSYLDPTLPIERRVDLLMAVMSPSDKMELIREGWGIPGIPHLGVPFINKVEAIHGYSYGSGATIFPQSIGLAATWNKKLVEEVASTIGKETVAAHTQQAWSPVLDVAQDPRWGRCEETYGEDPVLVSQIGGAWVKGYKSHGLMVTPKHFGGHGAPLGGRDSHDIGLSEREMREVHLVPFRHVFREYKCQSVMMAYSGFLGVPVAKSTELLKGILRDEWGFDGFIVSDCGAIRNLTNKKHYTAKTAIEAANQALAASIATNCGNVYNDKEVIKAANDGRLNQENLDYTCRSLLRVMFRNGLFEKKGLQKFDWDKIYEGWNTPENKEVSYRAALESMVLLDNKNNILPLPDDLGSVAVIGPGADDLQTGDYTQKAQPGQLKSVLSGIKAILGDQSRVNFVKGCDFFDLENSEINKAVEAAKNAEVAILVLGDQSTSHPTKGQVNTSGENHDLATLILPGKQQELLKAVCETGVPVILVLQAGRPYNLSYAAENCLAILVNWLPGQEGGPATADVLFGKYNPAGRLPMTFPKHVGQVPHYYNFKTSGRGYHYTDLDFYPLYPFGYGLSYTHFAYSDLKTKVNDDGAIDVSVKVTNMGEMSGDEVVQVYITDMYASVKTRVTELKDFTRVNLEPGTTEEVQFTLAPYQLSLLNDKMDRVVEPGQFRVMVGGSSPSYRANDRIKGHIGFEDESEGLNTMVDYPMAFSATFKVEIADTWENPDNGAKTISVKVKNMGNLTDSGKLKMYIDGKFYGAVRHFELLPGEQKSIPFTIPVSQDIEKVAFATKYSIITKTLE